MILSSGVYQVSVVLLQSLFNASHSHQSSRVFFSLQELVSCTRFEQRNQLEKAVAVSVVAVAIVAAVAVDPMNFRLISIVAAVVAAIVALL